MAARPNEKELDMKLLACALAGVAACAALPALAQSTMQGSTPWYAGAAFGNAHYHGPDIGGLPTDRTSGAGKIWGGWQFTPNFAAELGYTDLGKTGSPAGDAKTKGFFLDALGMWPVMPQLSVLGRLGLYYGKTDLSTGASDHSTKAKYGLGLQWDFNPQVGARLEYERYEANIFTHDVGVDMYSLGINFRF
jgi:OmpA-OmpF porin, OOP family